MPVWDRFAGPVLDEKVWFPYYLPHWSSREVTRTRYEFVDDGLRLFIPTDHPLWCPDTHPTPLRVSGFASGSYSGPVGSTEGPQAFAPGLVVTEAQPRFEGWLPTAGHVEIRCRMAVSRRSMAAMWLAGFEDQPGRAGEILVVEVFGDDVEPGRSVSVGVGHKQLGDPNLEHDFDRVPLSLDVAEMHTYAVDWDQQVSVFTVDRALIKRASGPPTYPMQLMVAVYDFPDRGARDDSDLVPEMIIAHIGG